jgi:hypothetical protein
MTAPETSRRRILVSTMAFVFGMALGLLSSRPITDVQAAPRGAADNPTAGITTQDGSQPGSTPVLVELFTSEGCSSCPSADTLLARLEREQPVPAADILALEEHVDYWDSLGWHDRFSSNRFSARQSAYSTRLLLNSEYTPQMIVDGTYEFVGNDIVHAFHAIAQAASAPKLTLRLSPLTRDGVHVSGSVSIAPLNTTLHHADLYAAVVESVASTQVLGGENGGQTLHHVSVVREMQRIGSLATMRGSPLKFSLSLPGDVSAADLRVVVFVQRAGQGAILGAVSSPQIELPDSAVTLASR